MSKPGASATYGPMVDTELIERLNRLNEKYRLGLAINDWPTRSQLPSYVSGDEAELWLGINQQISRLHRDANKRPFVTGVLNAYEKWASEQLEISQWVNKPLAEKRVLGPPHKHIKQLERFLSIHRYSSDRYTKQSSRTTTTTTTTTIFESAGAQVRAPEVQPAYPRFSSDALDDINRSQSTRASSRLSIKQQPSRPDGLVSVTSKDLCQFGSRTSVGWNERKRSSSFSTRDDQAVKSSRRNTGSSAGGLERARTEGSLQSRPPAEPVASSPSRFPTNPIANIQPSSSAKLVGSSGTSSRNLSFTESFTSAPSFIETPGTSFGTSFGTTTRDEPKGVPHPKQQNLSGCKEDTIIPAIGPIPSSLDTKMRKTPTLNRASLASEFQTTSSLDLILLEAEKHPNRSISRDPSQTQFSQLSDGVGYGMLQLERDGQQVRTISPRADKSGRALAVSTLNSSGHTATPSYALESGLPTSQKQFKFPANGCKSLFSSLAQSTHSSAQSSRFPTVQQSSIPTRTRPPTDLERLLFHNEQSPFANADLAVGHHYSFRAAYELTRVALHARLKASELAAKFASPPPDSNYDQFWQRLLEVAGLDVGQVEKSSSTAWELAAPDSVESSLSCNLNLSIKDGHLKSELTLKALSVDKSYRLGRKFGNERFLVSNVPALPDTDLTISLRKWYVTTKHRFLGRSWRAFFARPIKGRNKEFEFQVYWFAEAGGGFKKRGIHVADMKPGDNQVLHTTAMIKWALNFSHNADQPALKLFSRIGLLLTKTTPSVVFDPLQIIRCDDSWSCCPGRRSFSRDRHGLHRHKHTGKVMNDGCARISYAAALLITQRLKLPLPPAAFQGRIGGAKGVWFVEYSLEDKCAHPMYPEVWIEITDSQQKFDAWTGTHSDQHHLILDVHSHSHFLNSKTLSYSLVPILTHGGVPRESLIRLLESDLQRQQLNLEKAIRHGRLDLLVWIQANLSMPSKYGSGGVIKMAGAWPESLGERMAMLATTGHLPSKDPVLADACRKAVSNCYKDWDAKPEFNLPRCTNVIMIADPIDVLDEDEIFLQFSKPMLNEQTDEITEALTDVDVLVARHPAHMPSDIQKVRAVYKPELARYHDVIIFSSKGERPLADKLSGGDYDGDKAWVCWEPTLVDHFTNSKVADSPAPEHFGISKDLETAKEVRKRGKHEFLQKGIGFNLRQAMLGRVDNWYMGYTSVHAPIDDKFALEVGGLLGLLVDTAKNGYTFGSSEWASYLRRTPALSNKYDKPAWKTPTASRDEANPAVIADELRFWITRDFRRGIERELEAVQDEVGLHDLTLSQLYNDERKEAEECGQLREFEEIMQHLRQEFSDLYREWCKATTPKDDLTPAHLKRERKEPAHTPSVSQRKQELRRRFEALMPPENNKYLYASRWRRAGKSVLEGSVDLFAFCWNLLKASYLNFYYSSKTAFLYTVAGREFFWMKAMQRSGELGIVPVTMDVYPALKLDKSYVKRLPVTVVDDEDNDDVMTQADLE